MAIVTISAEVLILFEPPFRLKLILLVVDWVLDALLKDSSKNV